MNKRIEAVLYNKEAAAADYFELVNIFDHSILSTQSSNAGSVSLSVNEYTKTHDGYEFRQKCTDTYFSIKADNIKSVSGKMLDGLDTFLISVEMSEGANVNICIFHTDTNEKIESREHYSEIDVISLKEYCENKNYSPMMLQITDNFGFITKFNSVANVSLLEEEEDFKYILQIIDGVGSSVELPLMEDSCNEIYIKESEFADTILIRPYGQPFMEIKILFKKAEKEIIAK